MQVALDLVRDQRIVRFPRRGPVFQQLPLAIEQILEKILAWRGIFTMLLADSDKQWVG